MKSLTTIFGAMCLLLHSTGGAFSRSAYHLQPGDVVEVSVVGTPDLKTRAMIDEEGCLSVPLIPQIKVGGLTVDQARGALAAQLSHKIFQQRTIDGRDATIAIAPNTVLLTVAEYRPVYLNGDVTKPGQQTYRPGLTVEQAVALAGGYEIMRFRMNNPFMESADLRREHQTKWLELTLANAAIWRVQSELSDNQPPIEELTQAPLPEHVLAEIRDNARRQLAVSKARQQAELDYLSHAANSSDAQAAILRERQAKEVEGAENDRKEADMLEGYVQRGNLPIMRLAEVRRISLASATQSLQTSVALNSASRERDNYLRQQRRLLEDRHASLLKELDNERLKRDAARAALAAIGEKIAYTGMIRSQLARGGGAEPTIYITHSAVDGGGRERASETTEVVPGDTLDIQLRTESPGPEELSMK